MSDLPSLGRGIRLAAGVKAAAPRLACCRFAHLALLLLLTPGVAQAQTIGYGDAMRTLVKACGPAIEKHCPGYVVDEGLEQCFDQNISAISADCIATLLDTKAMLAQREADQANAVEVCLPDARRLCSNYNVGRGAMLTCLTRVDIRPKVSNRCNQAITAAGWR